jgi:hypothetical protein
VNLERLKKLQFYEPWGDVTTVKFDTWWKSHQHLFAEPVIKVLSDITLRQTPDSLIIEVPINQSTSAITTSLKKIIEEQSVVTEGSNFAELNSLECVGGVCDIPTSEEILSKA